MTSEDRFAVTIWAWGSRATGDDITCIFSIRVSYGFLAGASFEK